MTYDFRSPPLVASDLSSSNTNKVHCSSTLANWLGLVKGVIITEAWYWTSKKAHDWDGWFYRSQKDWEEKTGLSKDEIFPRLKDFEDKNWIERRRGKNPDPKADPKSWVTFYRCTTKFNDDYEEYLKNIAKSDKDKNGGNDNIVNSDNDGGNNIGISDKDKGIIVGKNDKDRGTTSDIPTMISPEPLYTNGLSALQGTLDQGSHEQGTLDQGSSCAEGENDNRSQRDPNQVVEQVQDNQKKGVASHSKTLKSQYEKEFEDLIWPIAYNKKAKAKAMSSYCTIRKDVMKTDDQRDDLLEAWRYVNEVVYPAKHKKDGTKQFIPMPTTWFNQHRWNDEDIQEGIHNRFITGDSTPSIDINSLSKEQRAEYERKSNLMAFYAKQQQKNGGTAA